MLQPTPSATDTTLGARLAHLVAATDADGLRGLFASPVTFRAVTPRMCWEASTPAAVVDIVLGVWFGDGKQVTDLLSVETDTVGDVGRVTYRLAVDLPSGPSVIEQVAYYTEVDQRFTDVRIACSGFRPA